MEFDGDLFDGSTHELIADEDKSEWKNGKSQPWIESKVGDKPECSRITEMGGNFDGVGERQD